MKRILITLIAALAFPASAQAYQFTFVTPIPNQNAVQRALSFQLNRQVAKHWVLDPVSFSPNGIPITVESGAQVASDCGPDADACHVTNSGDIYVTAASPAVETIAISHEIIETELDRDGNHAMNGLLDEACDPVSWNWYTVLGINVSDFVFPRWYFTNTSGSWDQMGNTTGPRSISTAVQDSGSFLPTFGPTRDVN